MALQNVWTFIAVTVVHTCKKLILLKHLDMMITEGSRHVDICRICLQWRQSMRKIVKLIKCPSEYVFIRELVDPSLPQFSVELFLISSVLFNALMSSASGRSVSSRNMLLMSVTATSLVSGSEHQTRGRAASTRPQQR